MSATGKVTVDNVKGFMVVTIDGVTEIRANDGRFIAELHLTKETATDLANGIRRSVMLPGIRVTSKQMREMRGKVETSDLDDEIYDFVTKLHGEGVEVSEIYRRVRENSRFNARDVLEDSIRALLVRAVSHAGD